MMTWTDSGLVDEPDAALVPSQESAVVWSSDGEVVTDGLSDTAVVTDGLSARGTPTGGDVRGSGTGRSPKGGRTGQRRSEQGSISLFILGLSVIAMVLVAGTVAVTSAHLARMRLLDVADGAALSAANALDDAAYQGGVGDSVPLSNASVRERAAAYVGSRPKPVNVVAWRLGPATGSPDGRTAVVALSGEAQLPMVGPALRELGVSIGISVRSEARSDVLL